MKAFEEDICTQRLRLRRLTTDDWKNLASMLQDENVMYAYEHAFSEDEVTQWLERQMVRYEKEDGLGLLAVDLKDDGTFIGQCGLTYQNVNGTIVPEIGYLLKKEFWHRGYASEAASAIRDYAFDCLHMDEVWSIIRENNFASQAVAIRLGMTPRCRIVKHYYDMDMVHICYCVRRSQSA